MIDKLLATNNENEIVETVMQGAKQSRKEKLAQQQQAIKNRQSNQNEKTIK